MMFLFRHILSLVILLPLATAAQWSYTTSDFYNGNYRSIGLGFTPIADSAFNIAISIFERGSAGGSLPVSMQIKEDATVYHQNYLSGTGTTQHPVPYSIITGNAVGKFTNYLSTGLPYTFDEQYSRLVRLRDYNTNQILWTKTGKFSFPYGIGLNFLVASDSSFWIHNPIDSAFLKINVLNGDTIDTILHSYFETVFNVNTGLELGESSVSFIGPNWKQSDTALVFISFYERDSLGALTLEEYYALINLKDLSLLSPKYPWSTGFPVDYEHYAKLSYVNEPDTINRSLKRTILKTQLLTNTTDTLLVVDNLPLSTNSTGNILQQLSWVRVRDDYVFHIEEYTGKAYATSGVGLVDIELLNVRLYKNETLVYEKLIRDTVLPNTGDHRFGDAHILADGRVLMSFSVDDFGTAMRLLMIDPQGNHFLTTPALEPLAPKNEIELYPNPTTDKIWLKTSNPNFQLNKWSITSISGKEIISSSSYYEGIDVSFLPAGLYLVTLYLKGETIVKKLVVN